MTDRFSQNIAKLSPVDEDREVVLRVIERNAIARFRGVFPELYAAIGMLRLGDHLGWRPLLIMHSKRTIRKYEAILDIDVREFFPEEGPSASRSSGFAFAAKLSNFWKAVSGEEKIEGRQDIE